MLKIRMQRVGRKHEPVFRLVLTDSHNSTKSGRFLEVLGSYDSRRGEKAEFKTEKVLHWIKNGAQLSPTVHNILVSKGIITGKKVSVLPKGVITAAKNKQIETIKKAEEEKGAKAKAEEQVESAPAVSDVAEVIEPVAEEKVETEAQ